MLTISQFIKPDMEVARSVNLERDAGSIDIVKDYQITEKTRETLSRFGDALLGEKISAWSLTGPYGMGKSSFINYLLALTSPPNTDLANNAWQKLNKSDPDLFEKLFAGINRIASQGFLQIPVTASYEAVNASILRGLKNALSLANIPKKEKLLSRLNKIALNKDIDSQVLLEIIKEAMLLTKMPAIVVIDEFGKNLDFMSHHPHKGDIFLLQQLAEIDLVNDDSKTFTPLFVLNSLLQKLQKYLPFSGSGTKARCLFNWSLLLSAVL
jgi:ABC-type lipoprotein export system ATPase subunit